jgi:hypothetical protein
VPPTPLFAATSADLVEALAYGGFRPGEILAACGRSPFARRPWPRYLRVCQRNVDGVIFAGTKSSRYPEKDVFLLGPLPKTIARRAEEAGPHGLLFPYPGTDRLWTETEYRNWREDYFVSIAWSHGLEQRLAVVERLRRAPGRAVQLERLQERVPFGVGEAHRVRPLDPEDVEEHQRHGHLGAPPGGSGR